MPAGDDAAAGFGVIVAGLQAQRDQVGGLRPELVFEDVPAPRTLAPYASAVAVTVQVDDDEIASGRLILLYDPAGQTGWAARCGLSRTSTPTWTRTSPRTRSSGRWAGPG